jgi:asparagine synthase (glutamine-hydrolysing)
MCGIVGLRRFDGRPVEEADLRRMADALRHRGPDGEGFRIFGDVGFGHRRLSIIDLAGSPQPMSSASAPCHLTYNGEIFNYQAVRSELERQGVPLRTHGDTEVLLETLRFKNVSGLAELRGQFAFGYFDERSGELLLARDRMGILPLYYFEGGGFFAFASEVKSLLALIGTAEVDADAVGDYLTYGSVPPPHTLFRGIRKLPPGAALRISPNGKIRLEVYWELPARLDGPLVSGVAAIEEVDRLLRESIALRLVADVPVGAYLSGGLDSSLTVALMKEQRGGGAVQTFSAGFADARFDELPYAREVSQLLGTKHHEVMVSAQDFRDLWEKLTWHRDGPLSQPADVAIFRIADQARGTVKVLLSGEGSDEIFGGYPKYIADPHLALIGNLPLALRMGIFKGIERLLPNSMNRQRQVARALTARNVSERMQSWFGPFTWYERHALRPGFGRFRNLGQWDRSTGDHVRRMLYVDCHTWLSDNLLERGDRMSMAASIENRPPFLDHALVELAFRLAPDLRIRGGAGKWVVKEIARRHLPAHIVDRKKVGFKVPLDQWFRGELREFVGDLILGPSSFVADYFDRKVIQDIVISHGRGRRNEEHRIWTLLGLEIWYRRFFRA